MTEHPADGPQTTRDTPMLDAAEEDPSPDTISAEREQEAVSRGRRRDDGD